MTAERPTTLLAELTHRCPLHCPYCSNPMEMVRAQGEMGTEDWKRVFTEARALGVLQLGLSGGEPMIRKDLEELSAHARSAGLYTTLVTSGLGERFPAGYPVAEVIQVARIPGDAFLEVVATPTAALDRSREVLLVWPHVIDETRLARGEGVNGGAAEERTQ